MDNASRVMVRASTASPNLRDKAKMCTIEQFCFC
jgi:hypothetical protein